MTREIYEGRFLRAREAMAAEGIDAWLSLGRETTILREPAFVYLLPTEPIQRTAILLTSAGERTCVAGHLDEEELVDSGLFTAVLRHDGARSFEEVLGDAWAALLPVRRLALNISPLEPSSDGLSHSDSLMLERMFQLRGAPGEVVPSVPIMKKVRGKKSRAERDGIHAAVEAAMAIYEAARPRMRVGLSGEDIQALFQSLACERRLGYSWDERNNPYVSVGARSSYLCKHPPCDVFVEPGDVVNVDFGVRLHGFASDNQRTFYALRPGEDRPPEEVERAFRTLQRINHEVCAAMRTGVQTADLTEIGNRIMLESGYPQGYQGGYGHEIGVYAHNGGLTAGRNVAKAALDGALEEYMTFTLEPAILTSHGRVCQEEVVCVTDRGGEMLSTPQTDIWIIAS